MKASQFINPLSKLSKVVENKFIPLSSLVGVKATKGNIIMTRTDGTNFIQVEVPGYDGEDFNVTISEELFTNLMRTLPQDSEIVITVEEGNFIIKNDTMRFSLPAVLDDTGVVVYPEFTVPTELTDFNVSEFKEKYSRVSSCIDSNALQPHLGALYMSNVVIGTNSYIMSKSDYQNTLNRELLITLPVCELINTLEDTEARIWVNSTDIYVEDSSTKIKGKLHEGIIHYPGEKIIELFNASTTTEYEISLQALQSAISRISIFISELEQNRIKFSFDGQMLTILSMSTSGKEKINLEKVINNTPIDLIFDVRLLNRFLKTFSTPVITLSVSKHMLIGKGGDTISILASIKEL